MRLSTAATGTWPALGRHLPNFPAPDGPAGAVGAGCHMAAVVAAGQFGRMVALREAFITGTGAFLPGEPVATTDGRFIGRVGGRDSVWASARCAGTASRAATTRGPDGDLHTNAR